MNTDRTNQRSSALRRLFVGAAFAAAAVSAPAHPGHGLLDQGPLHVATSPYHLTLLALLGVTLFAAAHLTKRWLPRRALQSIGAFAVIVSAVLWGLRI